MSKGGDMKIKGEEVCVSVCDTSLKHRAGQLTLQLAKGRGGDTFIGDR